MFSFPTDMMGIDIVIDIQYTPKSTVFDFSVANKMLSEQIFF